MPGKFIPGQPASAGKLNEVMRTADIAKPRSSGSSVDMQTGESGTGYSPTGTQSTDLRIVKVTGTVAGGYSFTEMYDPDGDGTYTAMAVGGINSVGTTVILVARSGATFSTNDLVVARLNPFHPHRWEGLCLLAGGGSDPDASTTVRGYVNTGNVSGAIVTQKFGGIKAFMVPGGEVGGVSSTAGITVYPSDSTSFPTYPRSGWGTSAGSIASVTTRSVINSSGVISDGRIIETITPIWQSRDSYNTRPTPYGGGGNDAAFIRSTIRPSYEPTGSYLYNAAAQAVNYHYLQSIPEEDADALSSGMVVGSWKHIFNTSVVWSGLRIGGGGDGEWYRSADINDPYSQPVTVATQTPSVLTPTTGVVPLYIYNTCPTVFYNYAVLRGSGLGTILEGLNTTLGPGEVGIFAGGILVDKYDSGDPPPPVPVTPPPFVPPDDPPVSPPPILPTIAVDVTVVDNADGTPIAGRLITVDGSLEVMQFTDVNGFALFTQVPISYTTLFDTTLNGSGETVTFLAQSDSAAGSTGSGYVISAHSDLGNLHCNYYVDAPNPAFANLSIVNVTVLDSSLVPIVGRNVTIDGVTQATDAAGQTQFIGVDPATLTAVCATPGGETATWATTSPTDSGSGFTADLALAATGTTNLVYTITTIPTTATVIVIANHTGGGSNVGRTATINGVTQSLASGTTTFTGVVPSVARTCACSTPGGESALHTISPGTGAKGFTAVWNCVAGTTYTITFSITP